MSKCVNVPHLPEGKVGLIAIGEKYRERLGRALDARGIEVIWLPDARDVDARLAGHADLSLLHLGGNRLVSACGDAVSDALSSLGFELLRVLAPGRAYPDDCVLNACIVGKRFIHRLDRNTSGIMIFALNEAAERGPGAGFKNRTFIKIYRARLKGTPRPQEGVLKGYLLKDAESASVKITDKPCKGALPVKTGYRVLESDGVTSLVEIRLYTGRTHQIRAQFAHIGCPVAGDGKYGDAEFNRRLGVNRQQLNARSLTLVFGQGSPLYYLNGKTFLSEG